MGMLFFYGSLGCDRYIEKDRSVRFALPGME
jgi:hypothetical protein